MYTEGRYCLRQAHFRKRVRVHNTVGEYFSTQEGIAAAVAVLAAALLAQTMLMLCSQRCSRVFI